MRWFVILGIILALYRLAPKHFSSLATDVLKLEWIRELQAKGHERNQASVSPESVTEKFVRKAVAFGVMFGAACMWLTSSWPLFMQTIFGMTACVGSVAVLFRITRHRRLVVLPLYLTLCRMNGSRWDIDRNPSSYVRVPKKSGKPILIRLPMDWHAGPMQLRMIEEIITARVPGIWTMEVDYSRFLLTFRPVTTSVLAVEPFEMSSRVTTANPLDALDSEKDTEEYDEVVMEKGSPW